jgi:cob(I)alamin adenosyltransferase
MKIYTTTGDDGTTGLVGAGRVRKDSPRIEAIGVVDELNASLGWALVGLSDHALAALLGEAQSRLFDLGAELACDPNDRHRLEALSIEDVEQLETAIDQMEAELEPLKQFILPGGCESAARLHLARTVCRRAERAVLRVQPAPREVVMTYLNRMSDFLFVAARTCNARSDVKDIKWIARKGLRKP